MSKKKVLVIGGTGIAGQFITDYLLHYHDICELFIASRGIHKISEKKVKFIKMDIHDTQNIESVIKQFDIIILALGPFSCVGTDIYTICLRNHVICVDINDDYGHSGRVLEIKNENITNFRGTIFTGMGLCPGLTTFMLVFVAKKKKKTVFEPRNLNFLLSLHQNSIFYQEITLKKQWQKKSMVILMTPIANT